MSVAPKPGGFLESILNRKPVDNSGICATCGGLVKVSDMALGCAPRDKFIIPEFPPYHGTHPSRLKCPDWVPRPEE